VVNSFRATYNRSAVTKTQSPTFDGPSLGINMTTLVPGHVIITAGSLSSASVFSYAAKDPVADHQLSDDLSILKGNHQLTFGANWIRPIQNVYGPLLGDGSFSFTWPNYLAGPLRFSCRGCDDILPAKNSVR
jgi:hypothetical protein